ncbi:GSCOCG00005872001-RA-CDS [Cotesia congregata]|nr:GSCOCG00005872001-RA-CDS [Cotesia congregata]
MSNAKKLTQHELRKAMSDHKKKTGAVKKIESPLAKYPFKSNNLIIILLYNDLGQLMCVICKSVVRSETVWPVHLNSKSHKDNVAAAKKSLEVKATVNKAPTSAFKRPPSPTRTEVPIKKVKGILKNSGNVNIPSVLPADFFDAPAGREDTSPAVKNSEKVIVNINNNKSIESTPVKAEQVQETESTNSAPLPEGFFDDPILDAKVRNVEYKNPVEEEWDRYLKEIKEETTQSAQIIAEDHELATSERQNNEIDEQMGNLLRVVALDEWKEENTVPKNTVEKNNESSSDDDSDVDEFLDWRVKKSYK